MIYDTIRQRAARHHLDIFGAFHAGTDDGCAPGTLIMLSPLEPGFWAHVTAEPELTDGAPDPIDRWSSRIIGGLADTLGGAAHFPFDGPPYAPFIAWAKRTGRAWASPVGMLVHDTAGLMISIRGAILLPGRIDLPPAPAVSPCAGCAQHCLTACPIGALGSEPYDVPACHAYLDTPQGADCLTGGCLVRQICPVSQRFGRDAAQSAHYMRHFHR
ncbi:ferredoxin [Nioella nitratireducens]|uniref:ferredoxin n=1 Tax=Nioella nitratireducens TaxID=1287720 RepID=UPI0008FD4303|nr:ferredoxin [Nioella nitratireducens]